VSGDGCIIRSKSHPDAAMQRLHHVMCQHN